MLQKMRFRPLVSYTILLCLFFDTIIIYDIPLFRQVFGFMFLLLFPGSLVLSILSIKLDYLGKFVLSWGISISILMLFGLLFNNALLYFGYERPLSTIPLLIVFNIICIVLSVIGSISRRGNSHKIFNGLFETFRLDTFEKAFLLAPILFPALGVFGVHMVNTTNDNRVLLILFFLIPIYVTFISLHHSKFSSRFYPIVIYLISISIILLLPFRSNHLIGIDTHQEYYFFQNTLNNLSWISSSSLLLDSTLSISLLPTIFQSMLNISPEFLFKILYPIIYSISPLIIYLISKKYVEDFYAFLTSIVFIFQWIFIWTEYNARTSLAILFIMLVIFVLFNDEIASPIKKFLIILFTASCVISHYSTTYIFFFVILTTYLIFNLLSTKYQLKRLINSTYVILFFVIIFFWNSLITGKAFVSLIDFLKSIYINLGNFFMADSRESAVLSVLGANIGQKAIPHQIEFVFTWMQFFLIAIGIITLIIHYKQISFPEIYLEKCGFLKQKIDVTYSIFAILCTLLLIIMITLPYISKGYGMDRLFEFSLIFLSLFFIIGGITLSKYLKIKPSILILIVLVPYFLSVTGTTYNIFDVHRSIILNSDGEQYDYYYIHDQETACSKWLKEYNEPKIIYTDFFGKYILLSQATYLSRLIDDNSIYNCTSINGPVFLRYYNLKYDFLKARDGSTFNLSDCSPLMKSNLIYNNAGSEVYI